MTKIDKFSRNQKWLNSLTKEKLEELLRHRTIVKDNCWLFSTCNTIGYGVIGKYKVQYKVHRLSACVYHNTPYDSELMALHKRECPNRNCWNPEHLYFGTPQDNTNDCIAVGTHIGVTRKNRTHCPKGHELTPENTYLCKIGTAGGPKIRIKRLCKTCAHNSVNNYQKRRKLRLLKVSM